jgi:hypothetical protein
MGDDNIKDMSKQKIKVTRIKTKNCEIREAN